MKQSHLPHFSCRSSSLTNLRLTGIAHTNAFSEFRQSRDYYRSMIQNVCSSMNTNAMFPQSQRQCIIQCHTSTTQNNSMRKHPPTLPTHLHQTTFDPSTMYLDESF